MPETVNSGSGSPLGDGKALIIAGYENDVISNKCYIFDSETNSIAVSSGTLDVAKICTSSFDAGIPYITGGRPSTDLSTASNIVTKYNYTTDSISYAPNTLVTALSGHSGVSFYSGSSKLAIIAGGITSAPALDDSVYKFNNVTEAWSSLSINLASPRSYVGAARIGNQGKNVMFAGGMITLTGDPTGGINVFDSVSETMNTVGNLIKSRYNSSALSLNDGRTLIAGGTDGTDVLNSMEIVSSDGTVKSAGTMPFYMNKSIFISDINKPVFPFKSIDYKYFSGSLTSDEYHSGSLSIEVENKEEHKFDIQTSIGSVINAIIYTKTSSYYSDKNVVDNSPLIELSGDGEIEKVECSDISDSVWTQYNITGIPLRDGVMTLTLKNRSSYPLAKLYIDDVSLI